MSGIYLGGRDIGLRGYLYQVNRLSNDGYLVIWYLPKLCTLPTICIVGKTCSIIRLRIIQQIALTIVVKGDFIVKNWPKGDLVFRWSIHFLFNLCWLIPYVWPPWLKSDSNIQMSLSSSTPWSPHPASHFTCINVVVHWHILHPQLGHFLIKKCPADHSTLFSIIMELTLFLFTPSGSNITNVLVQSRCHGQDRCYPPHLVAQFHKKARSIGNRDETILIIFPFPVCSMKKLRFSRGFFEAFLVSWVHFFL